MSVRTISQLRQIFRNGAPPSSIRPSDIEDLIDTVGFGARTGWAAYFDSDTASSPQIVPKNQDTQLINDLSTRIENEIPLDYADTGFIQNSEIWGREGDALAMTLLMKARQVPKGLPLRIPTGSFDFKIWLDIGGNFREIHAQCSRLGGDQIRHIKFQSNVYVGDTWEANGARVMMRTSQPLHIFDKQWILHRIHAKRN